MTTDNILQLQQAAFELAVQLERHDRRIVFAESCTAGLVSAALAHVPGVSRWHCGSAVVYREATKTAWLGISPTEFSVHNVVSREIAGQMVAGVLRITPEADWAAAITGHLGPDAPLELDGVVCIAIGVRNEDAIEIRRTEEIQLQTVHRVDRQYEAALKLVCLSVDLLTEL